MPVRLSGNEIVTTLANDGWELARVSGSHHIMRHASGQQTSVPVHASRPLPAGTLGSIRRDAGRTASQLRDLL